MISFLGDLKDFLEKIDHYRDQVLFIFIKPLWPRFITPNTITYFRIILGTVLLILLFFLDITDKLIIISLFSIGAISDLFDGSVARGLKEETEFGAMLDPIADRILILPIAVYSLYQSQRWLLLILLLTEILSGGISLFYKTKTGDAKANIFGKTRMVLLSVVFVAILVLWPNPPSLFFVDIIWISLIFSYLSIFIRLLDMLKSGHIKNKVINKEIKI